MDRPSLSPSSPSPAAERSPGEWVLQAWADQLPPLVARNLMALHALLLAALPRLSPRVRWGNVVYLLDGRPFVALNVQRRSVHLQALWRPVPPAFLRVDLAGPAGPERPARRAPAGGSSPRGPDPRVLVVPHARPLQGGAAAWTVQRLQQAAELLRGAAPGRRPPASGPAASPARGSEWRQPEARRVLSDPDAVRA